MYPTDIYDWTNDPHDYDNDGYHVSDSNGSKHRHKDAYNDQLYNMEDSGQYGELTCFEKSKIRDRQRKFIQI